MAQGKTGSSPPPGGLSKPGSQLDSMLGSLQSDLNKLGVATVAKGVCGACKKPIAGQVRRGEEVSSGILAPVFTPSHFVSVFSGCDCHGEDMAPRALCLHPLPGRDWVPELLRAGWTAVL